eukprot:5495229-Prymnesium_polylepis.1
MGCERELRTAAKLPRCRRERVNSRGLELVDIHLIQHGAACVRVSGAFGAQSGRAARGGASSYRGGGEKGPQGSGAWIFTPTVFR